MSGSNFRNGSWNGISAAVRTTAGTISTLLAIRLLGASQYGHMVTWLSFFILYLSLNSGIFTILVVKMMIDSVDSKQQRISITSATQFSYCSILILTFITLLLINHFQSSFLGMNIYSDNLGSTILLMWFLTSIQIFSALHAAVIEGLGRLDLAAKGQFLGPLICLAVMLFKFSSGQVYNERSYLTLLCLSAIIDLVMLRRIRALLKAPASNLDQTRIEFHEIWKLLKAGGLLQGASALNLFLEPANKFLLNYFAGSVSVTIYDLTMKVIWGIQHLAGSSLRVFMHIGSNDNAKLSRNFIEAIHLLGVPVFSMHIIGALFIFWSCNNWLVVQPMEVMIFFGIATISNLGMIFATPLYLSLIGSQDLIFIFSTQAKLALINISISSIAIPTCGIIGAGFGLFIATIFNVVSIYRRCSIDRKIYSDHYLLINRAIYKLSIVCILLPAILTWAINGGSVLLTILFIVFVIGILLIGEPLIARLTHHFILWYKSIKHLS